MTKKKTPDYLEIPVSAAAAMSRLYKKQMVVILGWDLDRNLIHTTTFGETPQDKLKAAEIGDALTVLVGGAINLQTTYEDFRNKKK